MTGGKKILAGLQSALAFAKCDHQFTDWEERDVGGLAWTRFCPKCKVRETRATAFEKPKETRT